MIKLNIVAIAGLVFLFATGTALANFDGYQNGKAHFDNQIMKKIYKDKKVKKLKKMKKRDRVKFRKRYRDGNGNGQGPVRVPEPATMLFLGAGLVGLAAAARKKIK